MCRASPRTPTTIEHFRFSPCPFFLFFFLSSSTRNSSFFSTLRAIRRAEEVSWKQREIRQIITGHRFQTWNQADAVIKRTNPSERSSARNFEAKRNYQLRSIIALLSSLIESRMIDNRRPTVPSASGHSKRARGKSRGGRGIFRFYG